MSALFGQVDTEPITRVEVGMPVVDSVGTPVGFVDEVSMSDPDAITTEGNEFRAVSGWLGDLARAFSTDDGLEPQVREPLRTRLVRTGYLKLRAPGHVHQNRYVRADRISRVYDGCVELLLTSEELKRDD